MQNSTNPTEPTAKDAYADLMERSVKLFEAHLSRAADGTFVLTAQDGRSIGIQDPTIFHQLKASLEVTNDKIRAGEIDPKDVHFYE